MEENSLPSSQSSDIHFISDFEKEVEKVFDWAFEGLKMKGLLKSAECLAVVKRVMFETFKKHESRLTNETNVSKSTELQSKVRGDLLSDETKNITINIANKLGDTVGTSKLLTHDSQDLGNNDNETDCNSEIWNKYYDSLKEMEEGEISCSTENTGVDEDEENIVSNINYVLNSVLFIHSSENPSIIKDRFQTKLKISTHEDAVLFVDRAFKECMEDTKVSKAFAELTELSQNITGQIPSTIKTEIWKKCVQVFEKNTPSDSEKLGFSYSENADGIKRTESVIIENYKQVIQKDNVIFLVGLLFKKGLVELEGFSSFARKLLNLAMTTDYGSFRYLCSLLTSVGLQFENKLRLTKNKIVMDSLLNDMQEYQLRNKNLPTEIFGKINDLLHLRSNGWKTEETDNLPSSSNVVQGNLKSPTVCDSKNRPRLPTVNQSRNKPKESQKESKTSRPNAIKQKRNQRKVQHQFQNNLRKFNPNQRNNNRHLEEELQKQKNIQNILLTNQNLLIKHIESQGLAQTMPPPRNSVQRAYIDNTAPGPHQHSRQNHPRNRGGQHSNYHTGVPPNLPNAKKQNRGNRRSPNWKQPKGPHLARKNIPREDP